MDIAMGTTTREITFKNRQTGRAKRIPAGQKVRIRHAFATGDGYVLNTTYQGDTYEMKGAQSRDFTRDDEK